MNEIVKVIGYGDEYMVSDDGIVFRITEKGLRKVIPKSDKDGYLRITLCKEGNKKSHFVHRLVAEAFIPNPKMLPYVNHIDENKKNNSVNNLEWCTAKYNNTYNGISLRKAIKRRKPIVAVGKGKILYFESITEASEKLNIHHGNICSCLCGRRKSAGGMTFSYWKG